MITDLPTAEDFKSRSVSLLNLAWEVTLAIQQQNDRALNEVRKVWEQHGKNEIWTTEDVEQQTRSFWRHSQAELRNAHALIHQAIELGLKGRICEVSPFLLIARDARDYPTRSDKQDTPFARFRTIDAADLIRVANSVCAEKLPKRFEPFWTKVREVRNADMHSIQEAEAIRPSRIVLDILLAHRMLFEGVSWPQSRNGHLFHGHRDTAYEMWFNEFNISRSLGELETAISILKPADCRDYLGFRKGDRSYLCIICDLHSTKWERGSLPHLAQLVSRAPDETRLQCCACNSNFDAAREKCWQPGCAGNVISTGPDLGGQCLTCEQFTKDRAV